LSNLGFGVAKHSSRSVYSPRLGLSQSSDVWILPHESRISSAPRRVVRWKVAAASWPNIAPLPQGQRWRAEKIFLVKSRYFHILNPNVDKALASRSDRFAQLFYTTAARGARQGHRGIESGFDLSLDVKNTGRASPFGDAVRQNQTKPDTFRPNIRPVDVSHNSMPGMLARNVIA